MKLKKKPDYSKNITTPEFNKLAADNFEAKLAIANLATKAGITNFGDKLKNNNKRVLQIKQNMNWLNMNLNKMN